MNEFGLLFINDHISQKIKFIDSNQLVKRGVKRVIVSIDNKIA